jgi:hypothetical protein
MHAELMKTDGGAEGGCTPLWALVSGYNTWWIVASSTHVRWSTCFLGPFRAEAAPMHARRYDIVTQATAHVLLYFGAHLVTFGHARYLTESLFHSSAHLFLWWGCHLPLLFPAATSSVISVFLRGMHSAVTKRRGYVSG